MVVIEAAVMAFVRIGSPAKKGEQVLTMNEVLFLFGPREQLLGSFVVAVLVADIKHFSLKL